MKVWRLLKRRPRFDLLEVMVDFKEISVVVQGAISGKSTDPEHYQITKKVLQSIRKYLPGAEIILSTWKGSDVKGLDYDQLVESDDPGAVLLGEYNGVKAFNNLNRQIVSSKAGLDGILGWISFYHHLEWIELYKKYCDPDYPLPINLRTPVQNMLSQWVERSPKLRYLLQWYDYRYVKLSQAWNSPNRLESFKKLLKAEFERYFSN